jgi:integrase
MAVFKVKKSGKWCADYYDGIKRHRREFKTKQAAQDFEATVRTQKRDGVYMAVEKIPIFKDVAAKLLASKETLRPGTWRNVDTILRRHLLKRWGDLRLDRVTVPDIEAWARELIDTRSAGTVRNVMGVGGAVFDEEIRHEEWSRRNPFRVAKRPVEQVEEIIDPNQDDSDDDGERAISEDEIYSPSEVAALIASGNEPRFRMIATMAAQSGMRRGELLALHWSSLTLNGDGTGRVWVRHSLTWAKGHGDSKPMPRLYPPKTKSGNREIPLPRSLVTALKSWRLRTPGDLVFPADSGGYPRPDFVVRGMAHAIKRARLSRALPFHSLRHYFCSSLLARDPRKALKVSKLAGHKNVQVTLTIYAHWCKGLGSDEPVDLLDAGSDSERTVSGELNETTESAVSA